MRRTFRTLQLRNSEFAAFRRFADRSVVRRLTLANRRLAVENP
jgi:hypothetical protein